MDIINVENKGNCFFESIAVTILTIPKNFCGSYFNTFQDKKDKNFITKRIRNNCNAILKKNKNKKYLKMFNKENTKDPQSNEDHTKFADFNEYVEKIKTDGEYINYQTIIQATADYLHTNIIINKSHELIIEAEQNNTKTYEPINLVYDEINHYEGTKPTKNEKTLLKILYPKNSLNNNLIKKIRYLKL